MSTKTKDEEKNISQHNQTCCGSQNQVLIQDIEESKDLRGTVQEYYAKAAERDESCCGSNILYNDEMLEELPNEIANFSLGCGNPITLAELQPGETVLDLGSGGGLDCFLAAREVGPEGHVIGIDMTPEMLSRAETAARKLEFDQVEFRKGFLEEIPG